VTKICFYTNRFTVFLYFSTVWKFVIVSLSIKPILCFKEISVTVHIFVIVRIWTLSSDRQLIFGIIGDKIVLRLSRNVLSMTGHKLLWIHLTKLFMIDCTVLIMRLVIFGCFQGDDVCLCLHKFKVPLYVCTDV